MMNFGSAIAILKSGGSVARCAWGDNGMFLSMQAPDKRSVFPTPFVNLTTSIGKKYPWTCSQADMLAEDWIIVDSGEKSGDWKGSAAEALRDRIHQNLRDFGANILGGEFGAEVPSVNVNFIVDGRTFNLAMKELETAEKLAA